MVYMLYIYAHALHLLASALYSLTEREREKVLRAVHRLDEIDLISNYAILI